MGLWILLAGGPLRSGKAWFLLLQEYSCITPALMSLPHIWAYDKMECAKRTISVITFNFINYSIVLPYFVRATFIVINVKILSESARRVQRKFLIQLLLQASVPLIFVMIPTAVLGIAVIFRVFGIPCKATRGNGKNIFSFECCYLHWFLIIWSKRRNCSDCYGTQLSLVVKTDKTNRYVAWT